MDMPDENDAPTSMKVSKKPIFGGLKQYLLPHFVSSESSSSLLVEEAVIQYDESCLPSSFAENAVAYIQNETTNKTCITKWTVEHRMEAPIYIYYQLDNYYQNHRRYVKSRNDQQLWSKADDGETTNCYPEDKIGENQTIVPCGLIAWSLFNDTYKFVSSNKNLTVNRKDIAWGSDRRSRFGSEVYPKNFQHRDLIGGGNLTASLPLKEQEDLIVWMRTAALPTFRKLYGKIEVDLEVKDEIEIKKEKHNLEISMKIGERGGVNQQLMRHLTKYMSMVCQCTSAPHFFNA
ncbi:unnamed protein product [Sphenostylis stenocarpa]|uniref:ALA-interacting subunit n=1 Tax=Sphenostylis stenocarpa TaxID=92480 RepID=A0AA86SUX8_9FABA|nr:unnamed protein product [Sphenostylis stenocarpa]